MSNLLHIKRARRIRKKLKAVNKNRYRLSIFRSIKNISAQIIDDSNNSTLVSASSMKDKKVNKMKKGDLSVHVAEIIAKKAIEKKITKVYFDRGSYRYHGRIKKFAETLRKNGLNF
jgi:large subunit ribosomal protein L18|tara:strand:- start:729 stop:1076 length:348 start_codon:yes stop_codon:yes gene_type:complete